jgi:CheY-like chemotaxis protein
LAVEDNAALRRVVMRQLKELGYRVLEAENAAAGLQLMEQQSIDLLLTDIVMPGGSDASSWHGRPANARQESR